MVTFWSVEASLDSPWYTDVLLYTIETHLKVEIVVVVSDNLWKFDTIPDTTPFLARPTKRKEWAREM